MVAGHMESAWKLKMTVKIVQFKWAGKKFFWEIREKCKECDLTTSVIKNMMNKEFKRKDVSFETKPWLDNFFYCISKLSWHPPIIMVNGRKFYQFSHKKPMFDRSKLADYVLAILGD